jgi:hypothetical protein
MRTISLLCFAFHGRYELRLAKEDISELNRKLGDATRQLSEACISGQGAAPRSPAAKGQGAGVGPDAGGANHMSLTAPPGYASGVGEDLGEPSQADMAVSGPQSPDTQMVGMCVSQAWWL